MKKNIILDFDGTLTDTSLEAIPFLENSKKHFCDFLSIVELDEFDVIYQEMKNRELSDPKVGWEYNGQVIAPAADPYAINNVVLAAIFQALCDGKLDSRIQYDRDKLLTIEKDKLISDNFMKSYNHGFVCFRESQFLTKKYLEDLLVDSNVAIVTNSGTSAVKEKLNKLGLSVNVYGDAKKYENNQDATEINPAKLNITDFPRPILLRRKKYFDLLQYLDKEHGYTPENTVIMGDIYELDLALPEKMGYGVVQIQTPFTPVYEVAYHHKNKKSHFVKNYEEALTVIKGLL